MYKTARNLTVLGIGLGVSAVVGWLLFRESKRGKDADRVAIRSQYRTSQPEEAPQIMLPPEVLRDVAVSEAQSGTESADDLTRIKDIGPRFAQALQSIGIMRFAQLATQSPEALADQLAPHIRVRADRIRTNDWIGQARQLAQRS